MIELITGLPGNAKTLYALSVVINRAKDENRPVYYAGLKEFLQDDARLLGTQWIEFDPKRWHEDVPSNSIILIDECQKIFRNRSLGSVPDKHVTELEEHRHKGLDFYMITQHPSLIDPAIRKLTQTHHHMVRIWGMEASTVHKWNGVKETCDKPSGRVDSEKTKWVFRKDLYGLYKSADAHTMKRAIPFRVKMLVMLPFVLALAGYAVYSLTMKKHFQDSALSSPVSSGSMGSGVPGVYPARQTVPVAAPVSRQAALSSSGPVERGGQREFDPVSDAKQYVAMNTPRVAGLPHTAPKYDEITKPVRAPVPAMCFAVGDSRCKCFTQQATPMDVPHDMCLSFARNGYFQDFDAEQHGRDDERFKKGNEIMNARYGHEVAVAPERG